MITVVAGGVGAARFLQGLLDVHSPSQVTIVSNVGDDAEFFGLHVSPDIDSVLYHLSGLADEERGFGITGDTYAVLEALPRYGYDTWFKLGDRDLATCIARTHLLRRGKTLTEATAELADALVVPVTILPVTNDRLRTMIRTDDEVLEFQEYFVKRRTEGHAREIILDGVDEAAPSPGVIEAIREALVTFEKKIKGFLMDDAVLTGVETRTSSPLRITRGEDYQSVSTRGLYPAGEGAGYAGGILSSAIDGIKVAQAVAMSLPHVAVDQRRSV